MSDLTIHGSSVTEEQAKQQQTYEDAGYRFDEVWKMTEGVTYPRLQYETLNPSVTLNGSGTEEDPYIVSSPEELQAIASYLQESAFFTQTVDIDLASFANYKPIGTIDTPFDGTYEGGGYKISNLIVSDDANRNIGLFGYADGATFNDMQLESVNVTGGEKVGGLIGSAKNVSISNVSVSGDTKGQLTAGLLAGHLEGTEEVPGNVDNVVVNGNLIAEDMGYSGELKDIGGMIGSIKHILVKGSQSIISVNCETHNGVGGLVGKMYAGGYYAVENVLVEGSVTSSGTYIGGVMGDVQLGHALIDGSFKGDVSGQDRVGGLLGSLLAEGVVERSYFEGNVTGNNFVGGLIGSSESTIKESFASNGIVIGVDQVGGLAGNMSGTIVDSYSDIDVSGDSNVGGLSGKQDANGLARGYAAGSITGSNGVGGLFGFCTDGAFVTNGFALNTSIQRKAGSTNTTFADVYGDTDGSVSISGSSSLDTIEFIQL